MTSPLRSAALLMPIVLSVACGTTAPTSPTAPSTSSLFAADLDQVTEGIVQELRRGGWDVVMAERIGPGPFTVGARRIDIPAIPDQSVYIYVYSSTELALAEASRLMPDGNLAPEPGGHPTSLATWWFRQYFHHRDRVNVRYGGCNAAFRDALVTLFGSPRVIADGVVSCDLPR